MRVTCFECGAVLEAESAEAVENAFVAHGAADHTWDYPEGAIRNFARNYVEAEERLSGEVERMKEIGEVVIHPVTEDRLDDWLHFFDHDGFAGNPGWASCYCMEPHESTTPENPERPWRETRSRMVERLRSGTTFGYLAYVDGKPAGWVNASLRSQYGLFKLDEPEGPKPSAVIGVSCFVVAPPYRRHGIAAALLDRVIADAATRGAAWIEGYPHNAPEPNDAGHFRGPQPLYEARGFEPVMVRQRDTVMRRRIE